MAILTDDFEGASSNTYIASWTPSGTISGWSWATGNSSTSSIEVRTNGAVGSDAAGTAEVDDALTADHRVYARFSGDNPNLYVCCRLVDEDNWVGFKVHGTGTSGLRSCERVGGGAVNELQTDSYSSFADWYMVETDGDQLYTAICGSGSAPGAVTTSLYGPTTNSNMSSTEQSVGICATGSTSTGAYLEDFQCEAISAATTVTVTSSLSSVLQKQNNLKTSSLSAALMRENNTLTAQLAAALQRQDNTLSANLAAHLTAAAGNFVTADLSAVLQALDNTLTANLSAALQKQNNLLTAALSIVLQKQDNTLTASLAAHLIAGGTAVQASLSAVLKAIGLTTTASLSAHITPEDGWVPVAGGETAWSSVAGSSSAWTIIN